MSAMMFSEEKNISVYMYREVKQFFFMQRYMSSLFLLLGSRGGRNMLYGKAQLRRGNLTETKSLSDQMSISHVHINLNQISY